MFAVGIAEGDVDAGEFFILQDIADHARDPDIRADSKFADAIRVFVTVRVLPEVILQLAVAGGAGDDAILCNGDGHRRCSEGTVALAEVVAHDSIHDEGAVDFAGSREDLAAWQVAPLIRTDDAAGLEPFVTGIELCADVSAS